MAEVKRNLRRWLLVLVVVLNATTVLIVSVSSVRTWRAKSQTLACMSKAMAIRSAIWSYSSGWDGWPYPATDGYVKMAGYKLEGEPGYEPLAAKQVMDFRCPADRKPRENSQGYLSSYRTSDGIGSLLSRAGPQDTLWVHEKGKRHPYEGRLEAVYVYQDGHAELGFRVHRLFPGVSLALWKAGTGAWEAAKGEQLALYPDYEEFCHFQLNRQGQNWHAVFVWLLDATTGWSGRWRRIGDGEYPERTEPPELVIRYDGLLLLPTEGEWEVMARGGVRRYLWLDADGNDRPDKSEVEECQGETTGQETVSRCSVVKPETFCRFRFIVQQGSTHPAPGLWRVTPQGTQELIDHRFVHSCPN